jgi:hypothetical protein
MKMGQTAAAAASAYNSYNWPGTAGTVGQQVTIVSQSGGITNLGWLDPLNLPWTAKGQLLVGTGPSTYSLLNVGANSTILIADSTTTTGLAYTSNYVSAITAGTNVAISGSTGNVTISVVPGGAVGTITGVTAGTGLSGGGTSGNVTLANTGVTSLVTSTGLSSSGTTGSVTLTNTGVTSLIAGTNITLSGSTGNITISASGGGGTGTVTSVDVSGGSTGLTFSGGPVTSSGTITAGGTLALASGGTGATTQAGAANNILPSQAGNAGKFLTTDGTNVSWSSAATDIPSGTTMLFMQAAAPTGWTQVTSLNDYALRLVSGTGGGTSGTVPFSTFFNATSTYTGTVTITSGQVGDTTLTIAQMPSHDHTVDAIALGCGNVSNGPSQDRPAPGCSSVGLSGLEGGGGSHSHTLIGVVAGGSFTSDFNVTYVNIIACTKN